MGTTRTRARANPKSPAQITLSQSDIFQRELAEHLGVSERTVTGWLRGQYRFSQEPEALAYVAKHASYDVAATIEAQVREAWEEAHS